MHTIDIVDVINYCHCPMFQKFYTKDNFKNKVVSTIEKFDEDMHNAIYSYHSLMQMGEKVSLKQLNQAFATSYIGVNKTVDDILYVDPSSWRDTYEHKRKKGLTSLHQLHKFLSKSAYFPLLVNYKYSVQISKTITLTGTIELVREINSSTLELIDFKVDDKLHNKVYVDKDIEITAACYAFNKLFNKELDSVLFYGLDKNKIANTKRTEEDYRMLRKIIVNVFTCIKNNIYYPCPSDKCNTCLYKSLCIDRLTYDNMI